MCPHTTRCVGILVYVCPSARRRVSVAFMVCPHTAMHLSMRTHIYYGCPYTATMDVRIPLYMCPMLQMLLRFASAIYILIISISVYCYICARSRLDTLRFRCASLPLSCASLPPYDADGKMKSLSNEYRRASLPALRFLRFASAALRCASMRFASDSLCHHAH